MMTGRLEEKQEKIDNWLHLMTRIGRFEIEWFMNNSRNSLTVNNEYLNFEDCMTLYTHWITLYTKG